MSIVRVSLLLRRWVSCEDFSVHTFGKGGVVGREVEGESVVALQDVKLS